jgi:hypothetical protein
MVRMAIFRCLALLLILPALFGAEPGDQTQGAVKPQTQAGAIKPKAPTPEEIIRGFSSRETEFYDAWMQYTYHQVAEVKVISVNGMPRNEKMVTVSDIVFKDNGSREIQILRRIGDLKSVTYTPKDDDVINNLQPFALTEKELPEYNLSYQGKEKIDELSCYVFSVSPKSLKGKKIYFDGKIWVDDRDLQIVRSVGKPMPQKNNNLFPEFETIRQMIDHKYWFPVWTHSESHLHFSADTVHIEETITYDDYKKFASKATIQFGLPAEKP